MEETYYKKVLTSSGEVPENEGVCSTDLGLLRYENNQWYWRDIANEGPYNEYWVSCDSPDWFMKSIPSPKEEAVRFGRELLKRANHAFDENKTLCWQDEDGLANTNDLYDKYM